tara:strand:+ start:288 stop:464 length:177 start_codon:yes stop_codon:yes gene_type:complete
VVLVVLVLHSLVVLVVEELVEFTAHLAQPQELQTLVVVAVVSKALAVILKLERLVVLA